MTKIITASQTLLSLPQFKSYIPKNKDLEMMQVFASTCSIPYFGLMPRSGINNLPLPRLLDQYINIGMPIYDSAFSCTWEEVTDSRAAEIEKMIEDQNWSLTVQWSGGIDSTCILAAIIKNFKPCNFERVNVACNWNSVIEHPLFYQQYVEPNFRCVDIDQQTRCWSDSNLVVGGEIADKLSMSVGNMDQAMGVRNPHLYGKRWKSDPDTLIKYISQIMQCQEFGPWLFEKISESVSTVDVPVETYFDFLWWVNFNYHWHSSVLLEWLYHYNHQTWNQHQKNFIRWYETDDYQKWSMNNGLGKKYNLGISTVKQSAKQYIYDLDQNKWYRDYKIKVSSTQRRGLSNSTNVFAITDDLRILHVDQDFEEILNLLPNYLGQC
jgi:hypothetical protein